MAIVKNTQNSDTALTLRVFRKNTNILSIIPNAGQYVSAIYPKYYLQLNNDALGDYSGVGMMPRIWGFRAGDGFIIRAEISSDAEGPFWGCMVNGVGLTIGKDGSYIVWYANGDEIAFVPFETGIHDYGFTGFEVSGTKYSQPYYDGDVVPDSSPYNFNEIFYITLLGGIYVGESVSPVCIHGTNYGIRIYDAIADTSEGPWHLYPFNELDTTSGGGMFETRNSAGGDRCKRTTAGSAAGGTSSVSVGEFPSDISGIGIQLPEDLRAITGSGYFDLLPLIFEDGGLDTLVGWNSTLADTNPSKVSETNQPDEYFAFFIGLSSNQTNIPLPDGCTATKAGSTSYSIGELIKGRKPKWNIWTDQIRFGKYAVTLGSGAQKVYFNIFYDNYGVNQGKFDLSLIEGYNTATYHAPKIGMSGTLNFEYHNGYCCRITESLLLIGGTTATDRASVFMFNRESGGLGNVKLGNLPLWNYTEAEQNEGAQTGLANLQACGAGLRITCQGASGVEEIALMCKSVKDTGDMDGNDPIPFCTGSSSATKAMFRDNGFDCTSIISDKSIEFMRDLLYAYTTRTVWAELIMTKNTDDTPSENAQIDCTNLVPKEESTANGIFDSNVFPTKTGLAGTNDDRFVVGEVGGVCKIGSTQYQIGIIGGSRNVNWGGTSTDDSRDLFNYLIKYLRASDSSEQPYGKGIAMGIGLKDSSNNLLSIVGTGSTPVMAFAIVTTQNASTGGVTSKMFGFTKIVNVVFDATNNNYFAPFAYDTRYWENKIQPWGINGDGNSYSQTKRGAAIFMWKDLKMDRNVNTSRPTDGLTCHLKVFAQNSGIHSWMPYSEGIGSTTPLSATFDTISENWHTPISSGSIKDVYFHNAGELLDINTSTVTSSYYVDAWVTLWSSDSNPHAVNSQIKTANALDGHTITLYEEVLHEPKEGASGSNPVEICHFTIDGYATQGKNSNNQNTGHVCQIDSQQMAPFFTRLPVNSERLGQFLNTGFYRIKIIHTSVQPSTGSMYYIKIS